jgi:hypothetical protein
MEGKVNVGIRGKSELTRKRHQIGILLKKAMRGGKQAKDKLQKEFGIKVYSSEEIGGYVRARFKTEMAGESPSKAARGAPKRRAKPLTKKR